MRHGINSPSNLTFRPLARFDRCRCHAWACFYRCAAPLLLPHQRVVARSDLIRRLTPICRQSQRINIFFVFNRSYRASTRLLDSHIAPPRASAWPAPQIAHAFMRNASRLRHKEKCGDELQQHHLARMRMLRLSNARRSSERRRRSALSKSDVPRRRRRDRARTPHWKIPLKYTKSPRFRKRGEKNYCRRRAESRSRN